MPFNVVYLHEVRGFELARVGLLLSLPALVALLVVGPIGTLIDRHRAAPRRRRRRCSSRSPRTSRWPRRRRELRAAIGCVLLGFSGGIIWPAIQTLIGTIIPSHLRQRYFGVNFTLLNLGIGIGGILGGLFVDVTRPETFVAIYLIDAATFLAPLAIFLGPLRHVPSGRPSRPTQDRTRRRRRPDRLPRGAARPLAAAGPRSSSSSPRSWATGSSTPACPPSAARSAASRRRRSAWPSPPTRRSSSCSSCSCSSGSRDAARTRMLVLMSGIWAVSFLALGATGLVPGTIVAAVLFGLCAAIFGFGETFYQPTLPAMVNDLAPDHLRGRYNAVMSIAWQSASVVGPAVAGILIGHGWNVSYIAMLVVGCVRGRLARPGRRAPHTRPGQRGARRRGRRPRGARGARSGVRADPRGRLDWTTAPRVVVPH